MIEALGESTAARDTDGMAGSALRDHDRKRAFVKRLLAAARELDDAGIEALAEEMARGINQIWLWDDKLDGAAPAPGHGETSTQSTKPGRPPAAAETVFDPFAFSVVVMLKRQGRAALVKQLEGIKSADHLRKIADAQHLGVDRSIKAVAKLREAIIHGAEQRLADRRAAAS